MGALPNVAGTTYTVSYNANGGSSTPSSSSSTYTYTHTYWNDDYGDNYAPGEKIYNVTEGNSFRAVWSGSRKAVTLASAISKANTTATRTVTFNANGGTCPTTSLDSTATVTHSFSKWAAGSTSGTQYSAGASFTPSSNTTMHAIWTSTTGTYSAITLPTPTRTGYDFKGWSTSSAATSGSTGSYTPTATQTLYATWTKKTYPVTYNANGHGTAPAAQTKTYGTALTLRSFISDQTIIGYTVSFNKNGGSTTPSAITSELTKKQTYWNTNSSGTGTNYSSSGAYSDNKAATLYAIWGTTVNGSITLPGAIARASDSVNYTISYNANGGTSTPSNQTITRITPYSFNKWAEGSASGTKYDANATYTPTAAKTMYAIWTTGATTGTVTLQSGITKNNTTATGFKVTFNANGGSCSTTSLNATDTTKWTFSKWNTKSDGTGTDYSPNTAYSFDANTPLYAKWTSSTTKGSITLPTPTRNGYTFQGWSASQSATSGVTGTYTPTATTTLYAIWSANEYIVTYDANGYGYAPDNQTKVHDITLKLRPFIADQKLEGYQISLDANGGEGLYSVAPSTITKKQLSWNTKSNGSGENYVSQASYTKNTAITLYAIWDTINGDVSLPTPTRVNYTFKGWSTDKNADSGIIGRYTPTSDTTLYAIWEINNSLIHYNNNGTDILCSVYYNNNGIPVLCNVYYNDNGVAVRI